MKKQQARYKAGQAGVEYNPIASMDWQPCAVLKVNQRKRLYTIKLQDKSILQVPEERLGTKAVEIAETAPPPAQPPLPPLSLGDIVYHPNRLTHGRIVKKLKGRDRTRYLISGPTRVFVAWREELITV